MRITVENYRGLKSAAFDLEGITLVAAPNRSGKSSTAQAVAAALAGQVIPIPGVLKTMAGMLVRNGAASGFAQVDGDEGLSRVEWPRAVHKTKGAPPQITPIAAGIESLTAVDPKRRAELFIELLNAHPTEADVVAYLARDGFGEELARSVWQSVEKHGWDGAHAQAKENGARLKGQWEAVTGERYGTKKAEAYIPRNWEPELAGMSEEALQARVTDARDTLDSMIAVAAVDDAEQERLQELADGLAAAKEAEVAASEARSAASAACKEARRAVAALRHPNDSAPHTCPHCAGAIAIIDSKLVAHTPISDEEAERWDAAYEAWKSSVGREQEADVRLQQARARLVRAQDAASRLTALSKGNSTHAQVDAARKNVADATDRLAAFTAKMRADKLHAAITSTAYVIAALDSSGIRLDKLNDSVAHFFGTAVAPLVDAAQFESIEIVADMSLSYGGKAWPLLSESEKYVVRTVLQVAIALRERADAVIIDAADILDRQHRNGLIKLLRHAGLRALVCMTIPTPDDCPDLQAAGLGASYWIRDGVVCPLASMK